MNGELKRSEANKSSWILWHHWDIVLWAESNFIGGMGSTFCLHWLWFDKKVIEPSPVQSDQANLINSNDQSGSHQTGRQHVYKMSEEVDSCPGPLEHKCTSSDKLV